MEAQRIADHGSTMERVQIAVDGDPAHAHCLGDVLDSTPQHERAQLVQASDRLLLTWPRQRRKWRPQFSLDHGNDAVE